MSGSQVPHGVMGVITPYATGPALVYYGAGYISDKKFLAAWPIFGVIFIVALLYFFTYTLAEDGEKSDVDVPVFVLDALSASGGARTLH